jgi:dTDP-4-amino-4,6-dideoxygalactose transaminase
LRWSAALRAAAFNIALSPWIFPAIERLPGLHIGENRYEPRFPSGSIDGDVLTLLAAVVSDAPQARQRREVHVIGLADAVRNETRFKPLIASGRSVAAYPRLALVAPGSESRELAYETLNQLGMGASRMYEAPLGEVQELRHRLVGEWDLPGAKAFAGQLLTLPTGSALSKAETEPMIQALRRTGAE